MTQCPKCGSNKIIGPKYHEQRHGRRECLGYTCFQCGYATTTPTKDAQKQAESKPRVGGPM